MDTFSPETVVSAFMLGVALGVWVTGNVALRARRRLELDHERARRYGRGTETEEG